MFYRDSQNIYRVRELEVFPWLVHGFGTRFSNGFGTVTTLRQIHSDRLVLAEGRGGCLGEGDALLDDTPGVLLGVKTADCFPILLVDAQNYAVAAVHAGWRGTLCHIGQKALKGMERFGTNPAHVSAALGPGIGKCCFKVGKEVAALFGTTADCVDLLEENRRQLAEAGVRRIYAAGLCTVCGGDHFCSYRREGHKAGRMLSVVGIRR